MPTRSLAALLLACLATMAAPAPSSAQRRARRPARPAVMLISDVTVVDGAGAAPKPHMSILIERGRIMRLLSSGEPAPPADTVVTGTGLFAMPGLIDSHVHIGTRPWAAEVAQLGAPSAAASPRCSTWRAIRAPPTTCPAP